MGGMNSASHEEILSELPDVAFIEGPVTVFTSMDAIAAEIARQALEAEGIPAMTGKFGTSGAGLALGEGVGGEVYVPAPYAERARFLLASLETEGNDISDLELMVAAMKSSHPDV
jgi:hypothetical protein